jgi:hypothetical protein
MPDGREQAREVRCWYRRHTILDLVARDKEGKIDGNDQLEGGGTRTTTHGTGRVVATDGVYIILTAEGYLTISNDTGWELAQTG